MFTRIGNAIRRGVARIRRFFGGGSGADHS